MKSCPPPALFLLCDVFSNVLAVVRWCSCRVFFFVYTKIHYIKFSKNYTAPVLVMSPFAINPGTVRDQWLRMYKKVGDQSMIRFAL